jgi:hypothetical protein
MFVFVILWKLAPGHVVASLERISPFHVGTPQISGTVVDAVTGRPVPGMDVCLLVTYSPLSFGHRRQPEVMRSAVTQTDASGRFSFARWDDIRDWFDDWGGYGIAVTDPAAGWRDVCGRSIYLLGGGLDTRRQARSVDVPTVFRAEINFHSQSDSVAKSLPPYFPVAMVEDPRNPHPEAYGTHASIPYFPEGTLVRKIGDPSKLRIALVPLLRDENECRAVQDSDFAELCRQMNQSLPADDLRRTWRISPQGE